MYERSIIHDEPMYMRPQEQSHQPDFAIICRQLTRRCCRASIAATT
jgi:hypothetical protein